MELELEIQNKLLAKFGYINNNNITIKREHRIFATVPSVNFREVFTFAINDLGFTQLCTITGLDEGEQLSAMYNLARKDGIMLILKIFLPKDNPILYSISDIFPGGHYYEREMIDLLGMKVEGLAEGKRYPLPDNWPENTYPLRKDFNPEQLNDSKKG
jgi:membrane-bound hydrogenase subunit beta